MSCAEGGSGGRGGRRSTNFSSPRSIRKLKFEPPPSPIRVASTGPAPRPCASRNASTLASTISGGWSAIAAMLRTVRRRLYLMRHAEVSYVGEHDPEVVHLTERGLEQAAAAHRGSWTMSASISLSPAALTRTLETAAVVVPRHDPEQWPAFAEWRGGRLDDVPLDELEELFVGSLQVRDEAARFLGGESLGEALDRVLPALEELVAREWQTALAVFHGGVNRILLSQALAGGRAYFGTFEQAPACINVLDLGADGHVDRADGQLHPLRPAPPVARDHDGAPVVGAEAVARRAHVARPGLLARPVWSDQSLGQTKVYRSATNVPQVGEAGSRPRN